MGLSVMDVESFLYWSVPRQLQCSLTGRDQSNLMKPLMPLGAR